MLNFIVAFDEEQQVDSTEKKTMPALSNVRCTNYIYIPYGVHNPKVGSHEYITSVLLVPISV